MKKVIVLATLFYAAAILPSPAQQPPKVQFITLGTAGGPLVRVERSEPANAVVVGNAVYLFDVGSGAQRQIAAAKLQLGQIRAVFLSHHHIDHNADIGPLLVTRWVLFGYKPLPIIGPPGTMALTKGITEAYHATELAPITIGGPPKPPIAATIASKDMGLDIAEPQVVYEDENIKVLAVTNDHYHFIPGTEEQRFSRSYAFRIEAPGRTIVFTGDTGPSAKVQNLAKGADLLVSEVIDMERMEPALRSGANLPPPILATMLEHLRQDHLTPVEVGKLADAAGVKEVVLTHFVPGFDGETDLTGYTKGLDTAFKGKVHLAKDLDRY
jgi:ribonuclease BN (tRNA processing enzyme)